MTKRKRPTPVGSPDLPPLQMTIGRLGGQVVVQFNQSVGWLGMSPAQAIDLGQKLILHGQEEQGKTAR